MNIQVLQEKLDSVTDPNYRSIIELIIDAANDYPLINLNDTDQYIREVRKRLNVDEITLENLKNYIHKNIDLNTEAWVAESLTSLLDAFDLMRLNKVSFEDVQAKIENIAQ